METSIEKIVRKLYSLSEVKILEVLDFVEFLTWNKEHLTSQPLENGLIREDKEFEAIADHLADEFQLYFGASVPALSDYAVSRAGIYEEHP
jgi:hypothetical protein